MNLYTQGGIVVKFDDAIPDLFVPEIQMFDDGDTLYILKEIIKGNFECDSYLSSYDLIEEILKDNAYVVNQPPQPNEELIQLVKIFGDQQKISAIKALRLLTNCGLKEGKEFVDAVFEKKYTNPFKDAAQELKEEFHSTRQETLGDILESALKKA